MAYWMGKTRGQNGNKTAGPYQDDTVPVRDIDPELLVTDLENLNLAGGAVQQLTVLRLVATRVGFDL